MGHSRTRLQPRPAESIGQSACQYRGHVRRRFKDAWRKTCRAGHHCPDERLVPIFDRRLEEVRDALVKAGAMPSLALDVLHVLLLECSDMILGIDSDRCMLAVDGDMMSVLDQAVDLGVLRHDYAPSDAYAAHVAA